VSEAEKVSKFMRKNHRAEACVYTQRAKECETSNRKRGTCRSNPSDVDDGDYIDWYCFDDLLPKRVVLEGRTAVSVTIGESNNRLLDQVDATLAIELRDLRDGTLNLVDWKHVASVVVTTYEQAIQDPRSRTMKRASPDVRRSTDRIAIRDRVAAIFAARLALNKNGLTVHDSAAGCRAVVVVAVIAIIALFCPLDGPVATEAHYIDACSEIVATGR